MKNWQVLLIIIASIISHNNLFSQETYVGYKPLSSFQQDTISYLQYNWGLKAAGMCYEMELSDFFSRFDIPIQAVEFTCATIFPTVRVLGIRFYTLPYEEVMRAETTKNSGIDLDKSSVLVLCLYDGPRGDDDLPLWADIQKHIPELKKSGSTIVPWKDSYTTLLGDYKAADIQYNFGI